MKDYDGYLNKQAEVLNEFDDFCEQFEKRASENFKNADKSDERFKLLQEISEPGTSAGESISGDTGTEE
ncbi:hypothetical protein SXBG_00018 [Synechococcus phage S-CAM1]|jgi:hypothetical protein|uniref:Uncharacterized protein n=1 Tax=Synechococcus phage S-CAM1 TaxID=754037 RepID=M4QRQ7_9CAUD|nr:hypothetical protein SXBG_00018 [Synechococcus phage S-CAM1]AGH26755.1 hypothetical protein SXBG_00018 [Synechococcus phage S-CAM1]AOV57584.1 hypothetical protein N170310_079 [Synechococcus phage S-CAM1]AOV57834.1 hypothetical protein C030809_079 [Synechococcus phage S-CAM1]AOV58084.1 hypothetical protein S170810_079 [Synechococcus phage S-CAM1]